MSSSRMTKPQEKHINNAEKLENISYHDNQHQFYCTI